MGNYVEVIKAAILWFPFVALTITLPFVLTQYHKYGSISVWKTFMVYGLMLYLTCAFFLVILPLPSRDEVAAMTTPRTQLVPFKFVADFIQKTSFRIDDVQTILPAITESYFLVPLYNILLTLPFGMFLRYYGKMSLKRVVLMSFGLSLFFEITQLTGLFFIYPRGYRLFDVDDLILNTLGGVLGYFAVGPLLRILPDPDKVNLEAREKAGTVSGFRRTTALVLNFVCCTILATIFSLLLPSGSDTQMVFPMTAILYYLVLPSAMGGSTLVEKFLHLKVVGMDGDFNIWRMWLRKIMFVLIYVATPFVVTVLINNLVVLDVWHEIFLLGVAAIVVAYDLISGLKYLFMTRKMLYEKASGTKMVSTIGAAE